MEDDQMFKNDLTLRKFALDDNSFLKSALCNKDVNGTCRWRNTVTLEENLACTGKECDADILRVVRAISGIHYEYVRPACVEQAFYADAKKVIYKERWSTSSCANPLLPYASEACCAGTFDLQAERFPGYLYDQERVTFSTANARCKAMGMISCDFNDIAGIDAYKKGFHWTTDSCAIQVKVNAIGQVALVYKPEVSRFVYSCFCLDTVVSFTVSNELKFQNPCSRMPVCTLTYETTTGTISKCIGTTTIQRTTMM